MQHIHASCHYVVTTTPTYCSAVVDLSRSRSVHAVEYNPCCPDPTILSASECKAVHYGLCSPLLKLPSFSIPPISASTSNSPTTSKGASPVSNYPKDSEQSSKSLSSSASSSPKVQSSNVNAFGYQFPTSPKTQSPYHPLSVVNNELSTPVLKAPQTPAKMDLKIFDPVELLAVDLEGKLEALVSTFVAQDKVRLAARKKTESTSEGNTSTPPLRNNTLKRSSSDLDGKTNSSSSLENELTYPIEQPFGVHGAYIQDNTSHFKDALAMFSEDGEIPNIFGQPKSLMDFQKSKTQTSSILSPLTPSLEYQQTGVKAQITKFASKEKEYSSPVNSLERRSTKSKTPEPNPNPSFKPGPLSLNELQELLKSTSEPTPEPIQTKIFQSSRMPTVPYDGPLHNNSPIYSSDALSPVQQQQQTLNAVDITTAATVPNLIYHNSNVRHESQFPLLNPEVAQKVNPSREFVQSPVDYAKSRFQQAGSDKEGPNPPKNRNGHLVTEARFKWENQNWPCQETLPVPLVNSNLVIDGSCPSIPHPKLTTVQKQHIKERSLSPTDRHSHVPIRPFLTKGSVAERVLLFECCPDRALERTNSGSKNKPLLINTWRTGGSDVHNKTQFWEVVGDLDKSHYLGFRDKENLESSQRLNSLKRFVSSKSSATKPLQIPKFYYPDGKPPSPNEVENHLQKIAAVFSGLTDGKASREEFHIVTKACGLPLYWKLPLFLAARGEKRTAVTCDIFLEFWRRVINSCHDEASKFIHIMSKGSRNFILPDDFFPLMQDVIDSHPGLTFLKEATEFHSRYVHTVIARIYYCVNRSWSGRIGVSELRKSNFLQVLSTLEEEEDINQITEYFSYEHFYVIYCKFWELDKDHDLYIDQNDLKHHNGGALSSKIIQRIFSGAVTCSPIQKEGKMSYTEFVWFLISEEDKRHPRSIEYWFRCMDIDGDGFLSMYELEYFYQEQLQRLDALGIETLPFNDCLCQMLDIIKPKVPGKIALSDLKKCKMTPIFFDTFFNLEKYLDHEQRDPFASQREHDGEGTEMSDWDRYAADEYELLVAEEGATDQQDDLVYQDSSLDLLSPNLDKIMSRSLALNKNRVGEDEFDYAESDIDYHF